MAKKTAHLDEADITEPKPNVAAQAMQGLGWSLDESELKEMYLNLLATASTRELMDHAHPSFAEIIRQLTAEEANALQVLRSVQIAAMCRITRPAGGAEGSAHVAHHILNWVFNGSPLPSSKSALWVNNWARLGLVEFSYLEHLTAPGHYDWMDIHVELTALRDQAKEGETYAYDKGYVRLTPFGARFLSVVSDFELPPGTAADSEADLSPADGNPSVDGPE